MIMELFDCGEGHYSEHDHDVCQLCYTGKPESRWQVEIVEGKTVLKKIWPTTG